MDSCFLSSTVKNSQLCSRFNALSPDIVLSAAEQVLARPLECHITPFNSYVNRVYSVKDADDGTRFIIKFYRPGRWSENAILQEHVFLQDCADAEISAAAPLADSEGNTLFSIEAPDGEVPAQTETQTGSRETGRSAGSAPEFLFALFPFKSGRTFDICGDDDYLRLGSLIGRLHAVSAKRKAPARPVLDPVSLTLCMCRNMAESGAVHPECADDFLTLSTQVLTQCASLFSSVPRMRIHGDCHRGNILDRLDEGLMLIDFDDMMTGPAVQDLWLLLPDHADNSRREMNVLLEGYTQFSPFPEQSLALIEPLRFMRNIYYLGWCAAQRTDAHFSQSFPDWGSRAFWVRELEDLRTQAQYC